MFENNNYHLLYGNCFDTLKTLANNSVQCVVTSPPYFSLRQYNTEPQLWGGNIYCEHDWKIEPPRRDRSSNDKRSESGIQNESSFCDLLPTKLCLKCDGWLGELGQENSPERFVKNLILVFSEVKRVLRDDGVCFVNIGDTYWNNAKVKHHALKEKDMVLIPQRFAIAMQESGWWVRNEIIWKKLNGLPESMKDRFSRNHETIWMFTKNNSYYFDQESVREPQHEITQISMSLQEEVERVKQFLHPHGPNKRTVWTMGVSSDKSGHVAPFCKDLPTIAIKVATSEHGACIDCMTPYIRDIRRVSLGRHELDADDKNYQPNRYENQYDELDSNGQKLFNIVDNGWRKNCECKTNEVTSCIVLDPFNGSGSTGEVAMQLGRRYIGCELNKDYYQSTIKRFSAGSLFI